ncbi:MAG: ABC transporter permease [Pseudomonadota bacterium]
MRFAIFGAMALSLWRDKAAFFLTFFLPPAIYAVFAAVFSGAASGDVSIRLGVTGPANDQVAEEIVDGLASSPIVERLKILRDQEALLNAAKAGSIDAGIEILRPQTNQAPRFKIYSDASHTGAAAMAEAALAAQAPPIETADGEIVSFEPAEKIVVASGSKASAPMAAYYAAGVGMLFVFLSGFQSALSVIEERDSGVMERIAAGPYGLRPMIDGKFAFLTVQGTVQLFVILIFSALVFKVPIGGAPLALLAAVIAAAICAAGIALAVVGCCRSRSQAHAVGAVLALTMGALGGSMAPRFLMPPDVRVIGGLTPNAWGIDALATALWRGGDWGQLTAPVALLVVAGAAGLLLSYVLMQRSLRA